MKKALFIFLYLFTPYFSYSDTYTLNGEFEYIFEVHSQKQEVLDDFFEYENESNSQKVINREPGKITVKNRAKLDVFKSDAPFPVDLSYQSNKELKECLDFHTTLEGYIKRTINGKEIIEEHIKRVPLSKSKVEKLKTLSLGLTKGAKLQSEAVEKIISYIREKVELQLNTSTDPIDVLNSGEAYCEGYANTATMMLQSLGIPSRKVSCYIPSGHTWGIGDGKTGTYHVFVEVYYKDKGWVSYDPQASIHYVDPFHIVKFPRNDINIKELKSDATIKEISVKDRRNILDAEKYPKNWNYFFKRQTIEKQNSALIVGTIKNRKQEEVKDSYVTKEWVFLNTLTGKDPGVRILPNGQFVIPVYNLQKEISFYYVDPNGGYIEKKVKLESKERIEFHFDLSNPEQSISLQMVDPLKKLVRWQRNSKNEWILSEYPTDRNGLIRMILDKGKYVFNQSKVDNEKKYVLNIPYPQETPIDLVTLPPYLDPNSYYIYGQVLNLQDTTGLEIKIEDKEGRFYPPIKIKKDGSYIYFVPDPIFNTVTLSGQGIYAVKTVDFTLLKHVSVHFDFKQDGFTTIKTSKPNTTIYFNKGAGRKYTGYIDVMTDSKGKAHIHIPGGKYYLSMGGESRFTDMKEVEIKKGSVIELK